MPASAQAQNAAVQAGFQTYLQDTEFGKTEFGKFLSGSGDDPQWAREFRWGDVATQIVEGLLKGAVVQAFNNRGKVDWKSVAANAFGNAIGNSIVGQMKYDENQQLLNAEQDRGDELAQQAGRDFLNAPGNGASVPSQSGSLLGLPKFSYLDTSKPLFDLDPSVINWRPSETSNGLTLEQARELAANDPMALIRLAREGNLSNGPVAQATPMPGSETWRDVKDIPYVGATLRTAIGLGGSYVSAVKEIGSLAGDAYNYFAGNNRSVVTGEFSADSGLVNSIQSRGWGQTGADMLHGFASAPVEFFAGAMRGDFERAGAGLGFYATLGFGMIGTEARVAISARIEANLAESARARASSTFDSSVVAKIERQQEAVDFYSARGITGEKLESYLTGINFSKPANSVLLRQGSSVDQWVSPYGVGNHFTPVGTPYSTLGIFPEGRTLTTFSLNQDVWAFRSTAADYRWPNGVAPGGETQYFVGNQDKIFFVPKTK